MVRKDKMDGETHMHQFHNADHFGLHVEYGLPNWWEGDHQSRTAPEGSVISQIRSGFKRGGMVEKKGKHPALSIAGTHIREQEHGEPIFTGRL